MDSQTPPDPKAGIFLEFLDSLQEIGLCSTSLGLDGAGAEVAEGVGAISQQDWMERLGAEVERRKRLPVEQHRRS